MDKLAKTISIHAICEMELINNNKASSFDYNIDLDINGTGQIIITPVDSNTTFKDVYLISNFDSTDIINEYSRIFAINLVANMELTDTEDDDYEIGIDDIGQVFIIPYAALDGVEGHGKFVSFEIEKDSTLITEDSEEDDADKIEEPDIEVTDAEVLDEDLGEEDEPVWEITYDLPITEDLEDTSDTEEDTSDAEDNKEVIHAPDAQTALKYAEQNIRVKAKDDSKWEDAEIIQIKKQ